MATLNVYKRRRNVKTIDLGIDVSSDTFESQVRSEKNHTSALIATWDISFVTDGTDGKLEIIIDDASLLDVIQKKGYMDIKRISGGEPYPVFEGFVTVIFHEVATA